jgi:hypothetical protein
MVVASWGEYEFADDDEASHYAGLGSGWRIDFDWGPIDDAVAWMPLPEAPAE